MKKSVNICEVGPRDGWQNLKQMLTFEQKTDLIGRMIDAGVSQMEITSFVSPKAIPQMADAKELAAYLLEKYPQMCFYALAPNFRGVQSAVEVGIKHIGYVISVSESHNKANIRRTHDESFAELEKILATYPGLDICLSMATTFGCPFEGITPIENVYKIAKRAYDMGVRTFLLADTIGVAVPDQVRETVKMMRENFPDAELQAHIHDTRNTGIANTLVALEAGLDTVQTTLGGLGGCPFAPGASGNTCTEDLVWILDRMGVETGIDFKKILEVSKYQKSFVDGIYSGHQVNITGKGSCF